MAVSKKLKKLYFSFFEKPEIFVANTISKFQERRNLKRNLDKSFKLTKEQKKTNQGFLETILSSFVKVGAVLCCKKRSV